MVNFLSAHGNRKLHEHGNFNVELQGSVNLQKYPKFKLRVEILFLIFGCSNWKLEFQKYHKN